MKGLLFLFLLVVIPGQQVMSQTGNDFARKELRELLDERKLKFDTYSISLEKRSGIFGNKTRNDIKNSSQVLIDIVKTDNRIINALYRVVDFRSYEKVNINYDLQKRNELLSNLEHATDTLSKQLDVLKSSNRALQSKSVRLQWLLYILSFLSIWTIIRLWRKIKAL